MEDPTLTKFDFNEMVCQARIGYAELSTRHAALLELISTSTQEAKTVQEQLDRLGAMLQSLGVQPEESLTRPRPNVSAATEKAVKQFFTNNPSGIILESKLIAAVKADGNPSMIDKSIQGALYKMSLAGKITRHGKRGSYSYSLKESVAAAEMVAATEQPFTVVVGDVGPLTQGQTNSPLANPFPTTPLTPAVGQLYPQKTPNWTSEARPNWGGTERL